MLAVLKRGSMQVPGSSSINGTLTLVEKRVNLVRGIDHATLAERIIAFINCILVLMFEGAK